MNSIRVMRPTTKISIVLNSAFLIYANYELYRVHKGTHPFLSPRLEAAGILKRPKEGAVQQEKKKDAEKSVGASAQDDARWMNVNGLPIPTFETLTRPFRRE